MGEFVAYYRVSTQRQGVTGLGLGAQRTAVKAFVLSSGGQIIGEFEEVESGRRSDRPKLNQAIQLAASKRATLVIAKLDRLARNVHFVSQLMESGVEFVATDLPHANRLTIHIIAAVAEYERELVAARTRAALRAAKARGIVLGNPNCAKQAKHASDCAVSRANDFAKRIEPHISALRSAGRTSYSALAKGLNELGIKTQRGRNWTATGVSNVLRRLNSTV